jgi:hypothetical protein
VLRSSVTSSSTKRHTFRVAHDNRYLRAEMTENTAAIREVLERLAERGYVDPDPALCPC